MEIYYKGVWVTMDDFTGEEWDEFDNFEDLVERESDYFELVADLDEKVDKMMTDPKYYDQIVGWF
jgi:hypothetical protein